MSNTDGDNGIARRKVLAAAAGVGGLGIAGGVGTASLLGDSEMFEENLLQSGSLDLEVDWKEPVVQGSISESGDNLTAEVEPNDKDGSALLKVALPEIEGNNNDGRVWLQPQCPDPGEAAIDLFLSIYYADSGGNTNGPVLDESGEEIIDESLLELAAEPGFQLLFSGEDCLEANKEGYLLVEWEYADDYDDDYDIADFDLELFARQCRNNETPQNPFPDGEVCIEGKDISWVAFCPEDPGTDDLVRTDVEPFEVTGPILVLTDPPSPNEVGAVILKYGRQIRVFDYSQERELFTTVEGGKVYDQEGNSYPGSSGRTNDDPCPDSTDGGLKYECPDNGGSCTFEKEV